MDSIILAALIGAVVLLISAWLPIIKRKTRPILLLSIVIAAIIFIIVFKLFWQIEPPIYAEVKKGLNTPPVFSEIQFDNDIFYGENLAYNVVSWSVVIKLVNNSKSEVVIQDVLANFKVSEGNNNFAICDHRPIIEVFSDIDDFWKNKGKFFHYPLIIASKLESYFRINFKISFINTSGKQQKYNSIVEGYRALPSIMTKPNITLILDQGIEIVVDMMEYTPFFVGQKLVPDSRIIPKVREISLGTLNTYSTQLRDSGIYWRSHIKRIDESGKKNIQEWYNHLPWYEGQRTNDENFAISMIIPFVTVFHNDSIPLEFFTIGFSKQDTLNLFRYISDKGLLTPDKHFTLDIEHNERQSNTILNLPKEVKSNEHYRYLIFYVKDDRFIYWPFKISNI